MQANREMQVFDSVYEKPQMNKFKIAGILPVEAASVYVGLLRGVLAPFLRTWECFARTVAKVSNQHSLDCDLTM